MIGKVPRSGNGFRGLVNYLVRGSKASPDMDRVAWSSTRNLLVDDIELAPRFMRAVAKQATRCRRPVYHLVISWHENENPSEALMRMVADATLADLQLSEHQAILIAHRDTDHRHLHIVANRVHPGTGKTWHASMDYARIERSLRRQAEDMNIPYVPGRFNDPEKFRQVPRRARDAEVQAGLRTGEQPLERFTRHDIIHRRPGLSALFERAASWDALRQGLAAEGLVLSAKGQGLVIEGAEGTLKLSDLGKGVRLKALEERFGERFGSAMRREVAAVVDDETGTKPPVLADSRERWRAAAKQGRAMPPVTTAGGEDSDVAAARGGKRFVPPTHRLTEPRRAANQALREAHAAYAFAKHMASLGVAGTKEVSAALADLKRAKEAQRRHQSLAEYFVDGIGEGSHAPDTSGAARPQSPEDKRAPSWRRARRERHSRKRRDDRGR